MFDFLKRNISDSVKNLTKKVSEKTFSEKDIDNFFSEIELDMLQSNVAFEIIELLKKDLKEKIINQEIKRGKAKEFIEQTFKEALLKTVNKNYIDLKKIIENAKLNGKPACLVFFGFNGSGKTTTIAKMAKFLMNHDYRPVLAAGDTFRAASIEQLEHHAEKLRLKTIKHKYGSDSAAVVFDAIKFAGNNDYDTVLADTAGRMHTNKNLMDELEKVCRVNKPDLKILVIDSLTGNDVVEQGKKFNDAIGIDAIILTKIDVNKKGGSILSVCHVTGKPVLFLGTGQNYDDLEKFEPEKFINELIK